MKVPTQLLTIVFLVLAIAGCGQSGPLYLPGNPSEVQEPPSAEAATGETGSTAGEEEQDDEDNAEP